MSKDIPMVEEVQPLESENAEDGAQTVALPSWVPLAFALLALLVLAQIAFLYMAKRDVDTMKENWRPAIATLDLERVMRLQQDSMIAMSAAGQQTNKAEDSAKTFGDRLEKAIEKAESECGCTILVSRAVVTTKKTPDVTPGIIKTLGLGDR